ncbi:MAG: YhcH/YjgK/YiaL family protein [Opitutaceae bacterium]|jgi:YhcH/YjgK/YiaL family protein
MALFGSLATVRTQLAGSPSFQRTLAYVEEMLLPGSPAHQRLLAVPVGETERVELGDGVFALEQAYTAKPPAEGRWEAHRVYIDVQVIVTGDELMEVTDVSRLTIAEDLTPAKDLLFFNGYADGSVLRMRTGELAVFYPVDAHKPSLAAGTPPALVRKTVVKVPVASVA